ncbi:MAG: ATP-binding protein [Gemmatimonadaceae bacterium]|nr:ATP-binding protein [Gemmatimonadaceae bacterium]
MTVPMLPAAFASAVVDALATAVLVLDGDGAVRYHNAAAAELLGLTAVTRHAPLGPAQPDLTEALARVRAGERVDSLRVPMPTDPARLLEVRFSVLEGDDAVLAAVSEVTDREALRLALGKRARELAAIFDATPSTVRVFDAEGRLLRANRAAQSEHPADDRPGTLAELLAQDRALDALTGEPLAAGQHPSERALLGEARPIHLLEVRRGGGVKIVESHASPVRDAAGAIVGVAQVDRDVTEREQLRRALAAELDRSSALNARVSVEATRLERMVEQRSRELLAMQEARARERRLASLGQLAAGVMHDVNNALNPIMAAAWLLALKADEPAAVRDYAQRIHRAAETGAATAARVGRFIRQDPLDVAAEEVVHLPTIADEVVAMTHALWAERADGGSLAYSSSHHPEAHVRALSGELREALLNLVHNAIDAMPNGGTLTIVTGCDATDAWIEVRDTGIGMSDEVRDRAFEPFFSTKGAAGSGLGLAEVYGIARRHRGVAEIDSALGEGTAVRLRFPRVTASPADDATPPAVITGRQRILLVEDHEDGRDFVSTLLRVSGHDVDTVASVAEARNQLLQKRWDVLITDLGLPDGSGWELIGLARDRFPSMRRLVVTGWEPRVADAAAAHLVLRKPVAAADLLAALHAPDAPVAAPAGPVVAAPDT